MNSSVAAQHKFLFVGVFAELQNVTVSFIMSDCMHGKTGLPLDGFSCSLIFQDFPVISWKIQVSLKSEENNRYFT